MPLLKDPNGKRARGSKGKTAAFVNHLDSVFQPFSSQDPKHGYEALKNVNIPFFLFKCHYQHQISLLIKYSHNERKKNYKITGVDLFIVRMLQKMPDSHRIYLRCNIKNRILSVPVEGALIVMMPCLLYTSRCV